MWMWWHVREHNTHQQMSQTQRCTVMETHVLPQMGRWSSAAAAAQWPDQRNPPLMRQSCCWEFICCLVLSNSHSVLHIHLRRLFSLLRISNCSADDSTTSDLSKHHIRGVNFSQDLNSSPAHTDVLTVWRQHNEAKTKNPEPKVHLFLPLDAVLELRNCEQHRPRLLI